MYACTHSPVICEKTVFQAREREREMKRAGETVVERLKPPLGTPAIASLISV